MSDKPTWIFCCGTYRSGSTTQYRLTADIVRETGNGIAIGYHTEGKLREKDNLNEVKSLAEHESIDLSKCKQPYVVCKVFMPIFRDDFHWEQNGDKPSHGAKIFKEGRLKAVCTVRNPLDIITSMKRRNEGRTQEGEEDETWDFNQTVTQKFPAWLGQLEQWIDLGPEITYTSKFEDFTTNLCAEVKRVAAHLSIGIDDATARTIAKRHTIQGINEHKRKMKKAGEREDKWLPSVPGIVFGTSGNWHTWLSGPEQKLVRETCKHFMERFGYE